MLCHLCFIVPLHVMSCFEFRDGSPVHAKPMFFPCSAEAEGINAVCTADDPWVGAYLLESSTTFSGLLIPSTGRPQPLPANCGLGIALLLCVLAGHRDVMPCRDNSSSCHVMIYSIMSYHVIPHLILSCYDTFHQVISTLIMSYTSHHDML